MSNIGIPGGKRTEAWHGKIAKWKILNMTKRTLSVKNLAFAVLESKHQYFGARIETKMVSAGFTFLQAKKHDPKIGDCCILCIFLYFYLFKFLFNAKFWIMKFECVGISWPLQ